MLEVVEPLRGGLDVVEDGTVVSGAAVVEVAGSVLLVDVVASAEATVLSTATAGETALSGEPLGLNRARPPRINTAVITAARTPESQAARVPRITSATSELAGAGSP